MKKIFLLCFLIFLLICQSVFSETLTKKQLAILKGARSTIGDKYDSGYYTGGPPPKGKGACPDVLYYALLGAGLNLQIEVDKDICNYPKLYPSVRDRNIDYRWCPNLIVWFKGYTKSLAIKPTYRNILIDWLPGDIIFWSLTGDGVADHCGILSDKRDKLGAPFVIHNFPPKCKEEDVILRWKIVGHFRKE